MILLLYSYFLLQFLEAALQYWLRHYFHQHNFHCWRKLVEDQQLLVWLPEIPVVVPVLVQANALDDDWLLLKAVQMLRSVNFRALVPAAELHILAVPVLVPAHDIPAVLVHVPAELHILAGPAHDIPVVLALVPVRDIPVVPILVPVHDTPVVAVVPASVVLQVPVLDVPVHLPGYALVPEPHLILESLLA